MKRKFILILLGCGAGLFMAVGVQAQSAAPAASPACSPGAWGGHHGFRRHAMYMHALKALDLSTQQQTEVKSIVEATHTQVQSVRANTSLTPEQKFTQFKTARQAAKNQIVGLLTPAQQQRLATMKEKFRQRHGFGQPAASPAPAST